MPYEYNYKVNLTYFKESGKYYTNGEYISHKEHMFEIFDEVKELKRCKRLPGLQSGWWDYGILIGVPNHPHDHPAFIYGIQNEEFLMKIYGALKLFDRGNKLLDMLTDFAEEHIAEILGLNVTELRERIVQKLCVSQVYLESEVNNMTSKLRSPIKYFGGKAYLAKKIIELLPPRDEYLHYVEPFFGSGAVLFEHDPEGKSEVVNDLNSSLTSFWRCLQQPKLFERFKRIVNSIPFSETEWQKAADFLDAPLTGYDGEEIDEALALFICCRQSRAGMFKSFSPLSRARTRQGMNEQAASWLSAVDRLPEIHERMKRVVILNRDAKLVIHSEDTPQTFFYLDPPYPKSARTGGEDYLCEMTDSQHVDLLLTLEKLKGKFILSSYPNEMYDDFATGNNWRRIEIKIPNHAAGGELKREMTEVLYLNY